MVRKMALAALLLVMPAGMFAQATSVLHIKVVLLDPEGKPTPVPGHALLISDNPSTTAPRLVRTTVDGTADVKLRPGNYTVESDRPVAFRGKAYQWTQTLDVVAGRDAVLNLTLANAEVTTASSTPGSGGGDRPLEADPAFLLPRWQDSVVELWTPTTHASGFVVDAQGLVATSQKAIGGATSAEVQLTPTVKVAARVLVADSTKDVAVLRIDPQTIANVKPIPLGCTPQTPALGDTQEVFTIGVPLRQFKDMTAGTASGLPVPTSSAGGPVFTAEGNFVGITSPAAGSDERRGRTRVVRAADACEVVAAATKKMASDGAPPSGAHLPIEPVWTLPDAAFKDAAEHRAGSLNPYQSATQSFDLAFITPVMIFSERYQAELLNRRSAGRSGGVGSVQPTLVRRLFDFANWSDYVEDVPSVLLVRVTPKMVEGFWQSVARGAAYTQGAAIPAFKHAKSGFARLRAYCGDHEVAPIHPFTIEQRVSEKDTISEGLSVFDPGAFSATCGTVKFVVYADKEPEKGETVVVEPRVLQQISQDFALYK